MKTIITGFNAFSGVDTNPSEILIQNLAELGIPNTKLLLLPTEYNTASEMLCNAINAETGMILMFGVSASSKTIQPERFALNIDDSDTPDNTGCIRKGQMISQNGPYAYRSSLLPEKIETCLITCNIPVKISNHAGTFVCNHLFYTVMDYISSHKLQCLADFIHIPPVEILSSEIITRAVLRIVELGRESRNK